ncbi:alpha/beta hydrolase [Natrialba sp. PRR66]|uniref:alpha/beta fold hydrolase n=1 Tax=Natrialba sp. PRR66 TaxID=3098146 RepID=UPI002B1D5A1A|nr:alpha/beta hydrolase [Natrialba sp. PRR66]
MARTDSHPPATDASALPSVAVESMTRDLPDVRLHVVVGGNPDGPLVVLLHGFPEFWYGWRHQLEALLDAGYRVVVPDQRGYNRSEKPTDVSAYRLRYLTRDIVDLIRAEGREAASVVGHDWGGIVAWTLATRYPDVVDRLVAVNAPHPVAFQRVLRSTPEQVGRSWYAFAFQLPWIPERLLEAGEFSLLERLFRGTAPPGTVSTSELAHYRRAWGQAGARRGMLNWYRAGGRYPPVRARAGTRDTLVDAPTLVVWGDGDAALVPELAYESVGVCAQGRLKRYSGTSHWVPHEEPARLTADVRSHLPL